MVLPHHFVYERTALGTSGDQREKEPEMGSALPSERSMTLPRLLLLLALARCTLGVAGVC